MELADEPKSWVEEARNRVKRISDLDPKDRLDIVYGIGLWSVLFHSGEEHARLDAMDRKSITQRLRAARTRGDLRHYQKGYSSAYGVRYRQDVKVRGISRSSPETNARNEPARKLDTTVYAIIG